MRHCDLIPQLRLSHKHDGCVKPLLDFKKKQSFYANAVTLYRI